MRKGEKVKKNGERQENSVGRYTQRWGPKRLSSGIVRGALRASCLLLKLVAGAKPMSAFVAFWADDGEHLRREWPLIVYCPELTKASFFQVKTVGTAVKGRAWSPVCRKLNHPLSLTFRSSGSKRSLLLTAARDRKKDCVRSWKV